MKEKNQQKRTPQFIILIMNVLYIYHRHTRTPYIYIYIYENMCHLFRITSKSVNFRLYTEVTSLIKIYLRPLLFLGQSRLII